VGVQKFAMKIVWDEPKRLANLDKHGLDFREFEEGFSWEACLLPVSPEPDWAGSPPDDRRA
jgi:uncharacterized DUF497 family protein